MKYIIRNKSLKTNSIINTDKIDTNNYKDIYKWVNNKCELDISKIIETRIDKFINIICPQIIQMVPVFLDYYREEKINYIVTSYLFTIEEHAAIAAANIYNKTKTIYLHHGSDAVEDKSRYFYLVRYFDYYLTQTKGEADYENDLRIELGKKHPEFYHANFYSFIYNKLKKKEKLIFNIKKNSNRKKTLLFVPFMCPPSPNRPMDKIFPLPMEFVKWHKALVEYFSTRKDYNFIWKGHFLPNQEFDLMSKIITHADYNNIQFRSDKLIRYIKKADKILCDVASTAFFESMFSGIPVLALYRPNDQKMRENAYAEFKSSLMPYNNIDEGIQHVEKFINGEPKDYIIDINDEKTSFGKLFDILIA